MKILLMKESIAYLASLFADQSNSAANLAAQIYFCCLFINVMQR